MEQKIKHDIIMPVILVHQCIRNNYPRCNTWNIGEYDSCKDAMQSLPYPALQENKKIMNQLFNDKKPIWIWEHRKKGNGDMYFVIDNARSFEEPEFETCMRITYWDCNDTFEFSDDDDE